MVYRRLGYLAALEGCLVLYVFYREWMAWLLLLAVACLPLLSLLVSLPAMLTVKTSLRCPTEVTVGQSVRPEVERRCPLPAPQVRCRLKLRHQITGEKETVSLGKQLPIEHCGAVQITPARLWVYDYLGLWRFPCGRKVPQLLTVWPKPVKPETLPKPHLYTASGWKPRPGGGFSENHDLRLYRPGDDLRHIHWKLAAKTGKLVYREPVEPMRKRMIVALELSGEPDALDNKLGQLLWTTDYLLEQNVTHEIRCRTGRGLETYPVADRQSRDAALRALLAAPVWKAEERLSGIPGAFYIGGDGDEA